MIRLHQRGRLNRMLGGITLSALGLLMSCGHTESFATGPYDPLAGPILPSSLQLTFNSGDDYSPSWTPDGTQILYTFVSGEPALGPNSRCIGMIPLSGGTRTFSHCDTRAIEADSSAMFSAVALRPNGELFFLQATGRPVESPVVRNTSLWLVDTAAPLAVRHELARLPKTIGEGVVSFLSEAAWLDENTFVALASRLTFPCRSMNCGSNGPSSRDTLPAPLYLVRGVMSGETLTLSQIPGTDGAARWAYLENGDLLFVRGSLTPAVPSALVTEPTVYRVPAAGGTPVAFGITPNGAQIRGLTCRPGKCLVLGTVLYSLNPTSGVLSAVNLGPVNFAPWSMPVLNPGGTIVVYRAGQNLFRIEIPSP